MVEKGYHDNTEYSCNFTFKNMAARFPEMSGEDQSGKQKYKTTKTWLNGCEKVVMNTDACIYI